MSTDKERHDGFGRAFRKLGNQLSRRVRVCFGRIYLLKSRLANLRKCESDACSRKDAMESYLVDRGKLRSDER